MTITPETLAESCGVTVRDLEELPGRVYEQLSRVTEDRAALLDALERISRAHDSGNNGAYMGEAVLCAYFADMARRVIAAAKATP